MDRTARLLAKILYGVLSALIVPLFLVVWAIGAEANVALPAIDSLLLGLAGTILGGSLMISGVLSLTVYGKGLPMNPFPPPYYVTRGIYRFLRHPIYTGFSILSIGFAILFRSSSGLWLVSPLVIMSCAALVLGYETIDLQKRFGSPLPRQLLHIPSNEGQPPSIEDRISVYVLVLLPWLILYEALAALGIAPDVVVAYLPFEMELPVLEWTEPLYFSTYFFVVLAPAVASSKRVLRDFAIAGLVATLLMPLLFATIPLIAPPRPFTPKGILGELLVLERGLDTPANAFPSYHVIWILLTMSVFAKRMPRTRYAWWALGGAISLSCITTGMHAVVDIVGGVIVFYALSNIHSIWKSVRSLAEHVANSWAEWHWRSLRIINHGLYAGIGSFLAFAVVGLLVGSEHALSILLGAFSALIVAALWAQFVEGSPSLLRPYGFYGGVLGIILGSVLAQPLFGTDPWLLLAAYSVAGPWVQSFGRLRCLVQGCCHGRQAPAELGITYRHPQTRVCRLAGLGGVPIHPTPVYSILWNVVIATVLTRLWFVHAPLSLIAGLYLILTGLGRFVEEAYRGEPQTLTIAGLRFYQWIALLTIVAGAMVTCVTTEASLAALHFSWLTLAAATVFGAATWFALGVDFPRSNRRFARLV
jgi:protein-S-isoprenylcysteine O-methyltransferase Ste14